MQQIDVYMLTALITIVVLAVISALLVMSYRRSHAGHIRDELLRKIDRLGVRVDRDADEHELRRLIKSHGAPSARQPKSA